MLVSSPSVVAQFSAAAGNVQAANAGNNEVMLMRMSLAALRTYLRGRRDALVDHAVQNNGANKEEMSRRLDNFAKVLEFADRAELVKTAAPGQVTVTLRVKPALPLRKQDK